MTDIVISQKQAQEFAKVIYADIEDYVRSHQQEFEEFLAEQRNPSEFDLYFRHSNIIQDPSSLPADLL